MNKRGMTLMEVLVVLLILGTVYNLIFTVYFSLQKQYNMIIEQNEVKENLALALEQIKADVINSQGVVRCRSDKLELAEGIIYQLKDDPQRGQHLYTSLTGYVLYRQENGKANQPIANFLQSMQVRYFDAGGKECALSSQVASVEIKLTAKVGKKKIVRKSALALGTGGKLYG